MATTFAVGLKGQAEKPHGTGMKLVEGEIKGGSGSTAMTVAAKDIDLRTIYNLQVTGYTTGTYYTVKLGTFKTGDHAAENYASVTAYGGTHKAGAQVAVNLGTFRIFAVGE